MREGVTQRYINKLSFEIIGAAIEVHKHLGPGLLESVYETCFMDELSDRNISFKSQVFVPIHYKNRDLGGKLKLDLLIDDLIIVENKSVEQMIPLYQAQLLSYMKLANKPKGLLINFNSVSIKKDLVSLITKDFGNLPE